MSEKTNQYLKELGYEPAKTKKAQPQTTDEPQSRDLFQTPNYAIDLLIPFIPGSVRWVWEPACGEGKIVRRLEQSAYRVYRSDIRYKEFPINFLSQTMHFFTPMDCIITNPPFSLKQKFYNRCLEYKVPFALLVPADYSGWIIDAIRNHGAEKIIPTRRIDYITPNILTRIHEGEVWDTIEDAHECATLRDYKKNYMDIWLMDLQAHHDVHNYQDINEVPQELLHKYSSSDFHSMWLTWGFGLGKTETFVELSNEEKKGNI